MEIRPVHIEHMNPYGISITYAQRHIQTGKLLHANFPVQWLPAISDETSFIKILMEWVLENERNIFTSSATPDDYERFLVENQEEAVKLVREMEQKRNLRQEFSSDDPSYPLFQLLTHFMRFCKKCENSVLAESLLYVACGMMDIPPPYPVRRAAMNPRHNIAEMRENGCFRLLKWIFPEPFDDGKAYLTQELMRFGHRLEDEIWVRATSTREYYWCIEDIRRQLQSFRNSENVYLNAYAPAAQIDLRALAWIQNVQARLPVEEEEEEEGVGEGRGEDQDQDDDQFDVEYEPDD